MAYVERLDIQRRLAFVPNDPLAAPVAPRARARVRLLAPAADARRRSRRGHRLGHRRDASGSSSSESRRRGASSAASALTDRGARDVRRGPDRRRARQRSRYRRDRLSCAALVAKVVRASRTVSLEAEAAAIRWASTWGARVINLSLGGLRDPRRPAAIPTPRSRRPPIATRTREAPSSSPRSGTPTRRRRPRGRTRATRPRCRTFSASARSRRRSVLRSRTGIRSTTTSQHPARTSSRPSAPAARPSDLHEQGYSPCGSDDFRRARDVVRGAAGVGRGRAALRRAAVAPAGPGREPARALGGRRERLDRLPPLPAAATPSAAGQARRRQVARDALAAASIPRPLRDQRRRGHAGVAAARRMASFNATIDFWDDPTDVYQAYVRRGQRCSPRSPPRAGRTPTSCSGGRGRGARRGPRAVGSAPARAARRPGGITRAPRLSAPERGLVLRRGQALVPQRGRPTGSRSRGAE